MLHTKYQPNIPGENVDFISFAIFSIGSHLGFSTKRNFIILKPYGLVMLHVKLENPECNGFRE